MRVSKIEGNADDGDLLGAEPFVGKIAGRVKSDARRVELVVEAMDERFNRRAGDLQPEVSHAHLQEFFLSQLCPVCGS
jgi:hypothetical protein